MTPRKAIQKILVLTAMGFLIPVLILLPVQFAFAEFDSNTGLRMVAEHLLPPAIGCCLIFALAAIASTIPKYAVSFVQSLTTLGLTVVVTSLCFIPVHHNKIDTPQTELLGMMPFCALCIAFAGLLAYGNLRKPEFGEINAKVSCQGLPGKDE